MKVREVKKGDTFYSGRGSIQYIATEDARLLGVFSGGRVVDGRGEDFGEQWEVPAHDVNDPTSTICFMETTGLEHYGAKLSRECAYIEF